MNRLLKLSIVAALAALVGALAMPELRAQDGSAAVSLPALRRDFAATSSAECVRSPSGFDADSMGAALPPLEHGGHRLRVEGDAAAVRLELHEATVTDALCALAAAFSVRYRSAIALDKARNGSYAGTLGRVIARVLDGYNYAIKHEGSALDVIVFGRSRGLAAPAPYSAVKPAAITHVRCGRSAGHRAACRPI